MITGIPVTLRERKVNRVRYFEDCSIGEQFRSPTAYRVTEDEMMDFARRWDPQPYHLDKAEAERLIGRIFAPGMLAMCIGQRLTHESGYFDIAIAAGLGLDELRMPLPVFADDELVLTTTITEMKASSSRPELGVMTNAVEVTNQAGDVVLSYRMTSLVHRRPAADASPSGTPPGR